MTQNRTLVSLTLCLLLFCGFLAPVVTAGPPVRSARAVHRVVFAVSGSDPKQWDVVLHNVGALQKTFGKQNTKIEVVAYGPGLDLFLAKDIALEARLRAAASMGVVLAACENTLRARHLTRADLFPFATPVDSGVAEIVRKEEAGWTYIKGD